jgi:hypothetical protein
VSGLREKIADLVDAISRNEVSEPTDAVLRVLAEHGDTQQVREQIQGIVHAAIFDIAPLATQRRDEIVREVMAVVAHIVAARDAAVDDVNEEVRWRERAIDRAERAEADLAAARQQLDHARADGQTAQRDLAAILRALDLGDHARMISSHYVVVEEVLPAIEHMRQQLDQVRALAEQTRLYPDTLRAILDAPARPAGHDETGQ